MQQILGQSQALDILNAALRSGRFHHACIFSGPRGVGKFTTALEVARVLLDPDQSPAAGASIQNPKFRGSKIQNLIDSSTHPDLHVIRKELALFSDNWQLRERKLMNIPVDLLRERMIGGKTGDDRIHEAPAYRTATSGHGKVFIIDEAELLDQVGQNSLLKTLEEPPPQTYFFLITSQPDRLLTTIRSRCQHVRFGRLDEDAMREWFERRSDRTAERQSTRAAEHAVLVVPTPAAMAWIEQFAEGSPGMAEVAIEYDFFSWRRALDPMLADLDAGMFPLAMGETMARLVEEFAVAWVKNHKNASKDAANKDGARHLFSMLSSHVRSKLVQRVLAGHDATTWASVIELVREAERELESNVNLKMLLENLVVQWSQAIAPAGSSRSR